ncbi:MAG: prefoldin subunit alpha [Candidatus Lokiarchaeota archaeon]|nr:prefoldin subunit alpha [Candidatus Lokiarchaeota archaeon]
MENPQQNAQALLYQLRYLREQRDMYSQQLEIINASLNNLINTKNTVENLKAVNDGEEILVPIGGILNLKAKVTNPDKVLLYAGHDVVIEKNLEDSIEYIDKMISQHNEQVEFLRERTQKLEQSIQQATQTLQNMSQGLGQNLGMVNE